MNGADIFCSACGARNPGDARFCSRCGTALHRPTDAPLDSEPPSPGRTVIMKWAKELAKLVGQEALGAGIGSVLTQLGLVSLIASAVGSVLLAITSGAHSFGDWLLLTWPLTFAVAIIVVLGLRVVRNFFIVPTAAIILFVALWLGTTLTGAPLMPARMPEFGTLGTGLVVGFLERFRAVYGTGAFVGSLIVGGVLGALTAQRAPDVL